MSLPSSQRQTPQSQQVQQVYGGMKVPIPENRGLLTKAQFSALKLYGAILQSLVRARMQSSTREQVTFAQGNSVWEYLAGTGGNGTGSGNMNYRGAYSAGTDYAVDDVVYTTPDSGTRISWIAEIANGPATAVHAPTWAEPGTVYWRALDYFTPGGSPARFQISTLNGDHVVAAKWDGAAFSGTYSIAKPDNLRTTLSSETIDGATVNYTYSTYDGSHDYTYPDNNRIANDGTNSETEVMYPRYKVGGIIYAQEVNLNATGIGGISWLELKPARVWSRRYLQP